jgi:hypothetical protein
MSNRQLKFDMENKITFFLVVGGSEQHYKNLDRVVNSIKKRMKNPYKIIVLEVGNKLSTNNLINVINEPDAVLLNNKKKIGYKFWQQKYRASEFITTEYGVYLDTDMVLVNDNFSEIFENIGENFGVAEHFWTRNFRAYLLRAVPLENIRSFLKLKKKINIRLSDPFFAGGVFIYKNNLENRKLLDKVSELYKDVYPETSTYLRGITDEVFFSNILAKNNKYISVGGALNHCCMGDKFMPLSIINGILYGKNHNEKIFRPVTFFHCDINRRDPRENYSGELKEAVENAWQL